MLRMLLVSHNFIKASSSLAATPARVRPGVWCVVCVVRYIVEFQLVPYSNSHKLLILDINIV